MRSIRLTPVRHPAPTCLDYTDEHAVRRFEREIRVHRGQIEAFELIQLDAGVDSAWCVRGEGGREHTVDIVDGSGAHDACTCPDFHTGQLGTCKHLEAVRRAIAGVPKLRRAFSHLPERPSVPTLTIDASSRVRPWRVGPWNARALSALGLDGNDVHATPRSELWTGEGPHRIRVVHAAPLVVERERAAARRVEHAGEVFAAVREGRVGVDVLSQPLFPYQRDGVTHLLARGRALLADDMGLGKTVQAIAACQVLRARGDARRIVVVTPASLKHQWAKEILHYTGERAAVVSGSPKERTRAFASDAAYVILNYELTWKELINLNALAADVLILDEAQRAKNFRTKTAATLHRIPSRFLFVLTGTPIENRLDDLYSLLQLVDADILGPLWKFNLDFHVQNAKGRVTGFKNLATLREQTSKVILRRRKEEVLSQLPPLTSQTRYTSLTQAQRELEDYYRSEAAKLLKRAEKRGLTPDEQKILQACLLKARQACNATELCDPNRGNGSPKLDEFEALIGEITEQGEAKVLVFSEWTEMLRLAAQRLEALGVGFAMLHGGVPTDQRPDLLQRFRDDPNQRVLLSTDAGGVGLNLQVATYVVHLDLPWNPGKLDQRTSRAHRLGQSRGVSVTYLCAEEGIERGIEGTLASKRAIRDAALNADSDVNAIDAPNFAAFLKQLKVILENLPLPGGDVEVAEIPDATPVYSEQEPPALPMAAEALPPDPPPESAATPASVVARKAHDRLRLAHVVLEARFFADAVRAAYDALATEIGQLTAERLTDHAALVAVIYRELLPSGRLPPGAPAALARLRDLTTLEAQGVEVPEPVAREAVAEAQQWVDRLSAPRDEEQTSRLSLA